MKHRWPTIMTRVSAGCLFVVLLLVAGSIWHAKNVQYEARRELSELGGTYGLASARHARETGETVSTWQIWFSANPIVEADLSVDAWPRSEPGSGSRLPLLTDDDLEVLKFVPRLQVLSLRSMPITDRSIEAIARLTELRRLDIRGTQISAAGSRRLADALPDCDVQE